MKSLKGLIIGLVLSVSILIAACDSNRTVTDIDGNVYRTVKIGDQVWLAENLKVTHYRNGEAIPNVTDSTTWGTIGYGAYRDYNNDTTLVTTYGRLYNWRAVNDPRNLAPEGWHVASDDDWKQLEMFLGMSREEADKERYHGTDEGGKLKESGTDHWQEYNVGATNEFGLTVLPGGCCLADGYTDYLGGSAYFWTSTEYDSSRAWNRYFYHNCADMFRGGSDKRKGYSVRCVKD